MHRIIQAKIEIRTTLEPMEMEKQPLNVFKLRLYKVYVVFLYTFFGASLLFFPFQKIWKANIFLSRNSLFSFDYLYLKEALTQNGILFFFKLKKCIILCLVADFLCLVCNEKVTIVFGSKLVNNSWVFHAWIKEWKWPGSQLNSYKILKEYYTGEQKRKIST